MPSGRSSNGRNRLRLTPLPVSLERVGIQLGVQLALDVAGIALNATGQTWMQAGADISGDTLTLKFRSLR